MIAEFWDFSTGPAPRDVNNVTGVTGVGRASRDQLVTKGGGSLIAGARDGAFAFVGRDGSVDVMPGPLPESELAAQVADLKS